MAVPGFPTPESLPVPTPDPFLLRWLYSFGPMQGYMPEPGPTGEPVRAEPPAAPVNPGIPPEGTPPAVPLPVEPAPSVDPWASAPGGGPDYRPMAKNYVADWDPNSPEFDPGAVANYGDASNLRFAPAPYQPISLDWFDALMRAMIRAPRYGEY